MITTDTGAKKIEQTDNWRQIFGAHNDSVDAYDANVAALQDALGIVVDGNKSAVSASSGQFIILKNSSIVDSGDVMLADGLYTAAKAIPANTVIDKTYLTADANGGLNALNSKIGLQDVTNEFIFNPNISWHSDSYKKVYRVGNLIIMTLRFTTPSTASTDYVLVTVPSKYALSGLYGASFALINTWTGAPVGVANFVNSNNITIASNSWATNTACICTLFYPIA